MQGHSEEDVPWWGFGLDAGAQQLWSADPLAGAQAVWPDRGAIHRQWACSSGNSAASATATTAQVPRNRLMTSPVYTTSNQLSARVGPIRTTSLKLQQRE